MENAADALKYALGMLLFALAITLTFALFSQARATSDAVFTMSDKTNYYTYVSKDGSREGRVVGIETIIPTLYRYFKENYIVRIIDETGNTIEEFDSDMEQKRFSGYTDEHNIYHRPDVASAPWAGNPNTDTKKRIDLYISGGVGIINTYYTVDYTGRGLIQRYGDRKFRENIRIYSNASLQGTTEDGEIIDILKKATKLEITYTLLPN